MYIRQLDIRDLRSFVGWTKLDLLYPGREQMEGPGMVGGTPRLPNVNVILGTNGSGKSTILDAVALGLLSPLIGSSGYRPYHLIRRTPDRSVSRAEIKIDLVLHPQDHQDANGQTETRASLPTSIDRRGDIEFVHGDGSNEPIWERIFTEDSAAFFMVGYGATRRVEALSATDLATRRKQRLVRYERVASLFEEHFALTPLNAWLPEWQQRNPGRHKQVINLINKLLPSEQQFTGTLEDGEYLFASGKVTVPFGALSDGYKAYIGWIGDLLYHVCMGAPKGAKLVDSRGIILVDEIDLHIHPAWQRTLIPDLAKALPNMQFIFTTHSPLVVGTLEAANLHFIKKRGSRPILVRPSQETWGLTADQILRSDMFQLDTTRDPEFQKELNLLSKQASSGDADAALRFMRSAALGVAGTRAGPVNPSKPDWLVHHTKSEPEPA